MYPCALPSCFLLETRALPADAERVVYSVILDAHDALAGRAANRHRVRAEAIAYVLRPYDVLNRASSDLSEPAALRTGDHGACLAASAARASSRPEAVDWRNNWRATSFRDQESRRLQVVRANGTPLSKPRALVRFRPGASRCSCQITRMGGHFPAIALRSASAL
jgi:hypothetical protein